MYITTDCYATNMKPLFIASITTILVVFMVTFIASSLDTASKMHIVISLAIAGVATLVALFIVVFWAIPVHLLLKRSNQSHLLWYIVAAIVPSFIFIYGFNPFGYDSNIDLFLTSIIL